MARLYYGRLPAGGPVFLLDGERLVQRLQRQKWSLERVADELAATLAREPEGVRYWTMNPLLVNWLADEVAIARLWCCDRDGREFAFRDDESLMKKLSVMGPGEAVADDARFF